MITSLLTSAKILLKKPQTIIVPLIAFLVFMGALYVTSDAIVDLLFDAMLMGRIPETGGIEFPWQLYLQYASQFNIIALAGFISVVFFVWASSFFAVFARENMEKEESFFTAMREANGLFGRIIKLVFFSAIIYLFFFIVLWVGANSFVSLGQIGLIFPLLMLLIAFFLYITLYFVVPIMAIENVSIREAMKRSVAFAGKRFWQVFILAIVSGVIYAEILDIGDSLSNMVSNEALSWIVLGVFWAIAWGFLNLVMPVYYLRKKTA